MNPKDLFQENELQQSPDQYFNSIREKLQQPEKKGRQLTVEEERKKQDGFALGEMMKSAGWAIVLDILQNMPKSHVDPRGMSEDDWKFAELNAFWQGAVAKELLDGLYELVNNAHMLQQIELGEIADVKKMRV